MDGCNTSAWEVVLSVTHSSLIYRFRRADLEVYSQVRTAIAQQGAVLILERDF